ncbi:hypothetical protein BN7_376 [Wickerhamomyces ciferrii]|uniref:Uncharacterized protein n=1 Tax=Wickerhamomyces ciferrii (strain ATCC 14091 / BCRC 22168 / CBS 111 / JCM 3599 / NBRC 0793 / NRRL Y-1031 F-60-10) TaxID=1206466 RepID=K0KF49_WICCF|nr:uncharacterized protein BN7_376 [Wickerhamomyces ciferrii]CCH40842.1 hypothetical protein BN7_376 [Wickerhamomyces ciferrii]
MVAYTSDKISIDLFTQRFQNLFGYNAIEFPSKDFQTWRDFFDPEIRDDLTEADLLEAGIFSYQLGESLLKINGSAFIEFYLKLTEAKIGDKEVVIDDNIDDLTGFEKFYNEPYLNFRHSNADQNYIAKSSSFYDEDLKVIIEHGLKTIKGDIPGLMHKHTNESSYIGMHVNQKLAEALCDSINFSTGNAMSNYNKRHKNEFIKILKSVLQPCIQRFNLIFNDTLRMIERFTVATDDFFEYHPLGNNVMRSSLLGEVGVQDIFIGSATDAARRWIIEIISPNDIETLYQLVKNQLTGDSPDFTRANTFLCYFLIRQIQLGVGDILVTDGFDYLYIELDFLNTLSGDIKFNYYEFQHTTTAPITLREFFFWWFYKRKELEGNQLKPLAQLINMHLKRWETSKNGERIPDVVAKGIYKFGLNNDTQ